ncbi:MAG: 30S ribosomal protein S6 [Microgenomates group bacterium]|jgi:ribosomal protein S6|nr:30S ribosomal protein S6 [Candidatus Woesebacteria bacterium]MBP6883343.1 30S ribosomal protein S6 [Candidatus Woesebacteria bacterium]
MSAYDFVFLLNQEEEMGNLKTLITSLEGTVQEEKQHGKKTLAYPIKKLMEASLYQWKITMPKNKVTEFKKKLGLNEVLIRYLLLDIS